MSGKGWGGRIKRRRWEDTSVDHRSEAMGGRLSDSPGCALSKVRWYRWKLRLDAQQFGSWHIKHFPPILWGDAECLQDQGGRLGGYLAREHAHPRPALDRRLVKVGRSLRHRIETGCLCA